MKNQILRMPTLLLVLSLIVACSEKPGSTDVGAEPAQLTDITIAQFGHVFIYLPLYVAVDGGFFEAEGLNVDLINGGGDEKTFAAVASGQAQFGVADPTFAAIARERGQPGVVVGTVVSGAPFWGVTWNPDIPYVNSPSQLRDLRIATYQAPSTNYALMAKTLEDHKDKVGKATVVEGAFGGLLAMLDADRADVAMVLEPTVSTAVNSGARVVYSYPETYGAFFLTGIYALESYRDTNPEIVQSVVNALEKAMRFSHDNPDGAAKIAEAAFPELSPEVVRNALDRMLAEDTIPSSARIDPKGWENAIAVRLALGDIKSKEIADDTLDYTFSERAATQP